MVVRLFVVLSLLNDINSLYEEIVEELDDFKIAILALEVWSLQFLVALETALPKDILRSTRNYESYLFKKYVCLPKMQHLNPTLLRLEEKNLNHFSTYFEVFFLFQGWEMLEILVIQTFFQAQ